MLGIDLHLFNRNNNRNLFYRGIVFISFGNSGQGTCPGTRSACLVFQFVMNRYAVCYSRAKALLDLHKSPGCDVIGWG